MKKLILLLNLLLLVRIADAQNYPPTAIVAAEYFFDTDPGLGNATSIALTQEGLNSLSIPIPNSLSIGTHILGIRIKNADKTWSLFQNRSFEVVELKPPSNPIVSAEYFFDTDPGFGNGIAISIQSGESISQNLAISVPNSLAVGNHLLSIRVKDATNKWSLMQVRQITVEPNPCIDFQAPVITTNSPICNGNTLNLSTNEATTYAWSGPNGFSSTLQNPVLNNLTNSESGTYTLTTYNNAGCSNSATINITVNSSPSVTTIFNVPVCEGMPLHLNAEIEGGGAMSYLWSGPNSFSSTLSRPSIGNTTTTNSGVYTFIVTNTQGCAATNTAEITINPQNSNLCSSNMRALSHATGFISIVGTEDVGGTAFVIGDKLLMTAKHVIDEFTGNQLRLRLNGVISTVSFTKVFEGDFNGENYNQDIAIIRLSGLNADLFNYLPLPITDLPPIQNSPVSTYGGTNIIPDEGVLLGSGGGIIFTDLISCFNGQSGSPLVNNDGKVIGILSFRTETLQECGWLDITRFLNQISDVITQNTNIDTTLPGDYESIQSGNWEDASTWMVYTGSDPEFPYDFATTPPPVNVKVRISSDHIVTLNAPATVRTMYLEHSAKFIQNSNLTISTPNITVKIDGEYQWNSGKVSGNVNLQVFRKFEWNGGTLEANLILGKSCQSKKLSTSTVIIQNGFKVINNGIFDWQDGNFELNNGTFENTATATFLASGNNDMLDVSGINLFKNSGKLIKDNALGETTIEVPYEGNNESLLKGNGEISFTNPTTPIEKIAVGNQIGKLTVNTPNPLFTPASHLFIDLNDGTGVGTGHDQLELNSNLTLAGKLIVREATYVPVGTYTIVNLTSGIISGSFSEIELPENYAIVINPTNIQVTKQADSHMAGSGKSLTLGGGKTLTASNNDLLNFDANNDFSIDFWLKNSSTGQSGDTKIILKKGSPENGISFMIYRDYQYIFFLHSEGANFTTNYARIIDDDKFHHYYFSMGNIYIDGISRGGTAEKFTSTPINISQELTIGIGVPSLEFGGFTGEIDELRIWNTYLEAFPQDKLRDRICRKITPNDPLFEHLVAYYNFDENSGSTVFDHSATGNNATLSNASARITSSAAIGDISTYQYVRPFGANTALPSVSLNLNNQDSFSVNVNDAGGYILTGTRNEGGTHIYAINEKPNTENGIFGIGSNNRYFGVYNANFASPIYSATYNYTGNPFVTSGNENQLNLYKRENNAAQTWENTMATLDLNAKILSIEGQNTEYMLGLSDVCQSETPLYISRDTSPCLGSALFLSGLGGNSLQATSFSWTGPNSFSSDARYPIVENLTFANSGTYQLTTNDAMGCVQTATIFVTIVETTTPTINKALTCQDELLTVWNNKFGGENNTFDWVNKVFVNDENKIIAVGNGFKYSVIYEDGVKRWDKTFDLTPNFTGNINDALLLSNGNYLLGGIETDGTTRRFLVIKSDKYGAVIWEKRFNGDAEDNLISMVETSEGGFLLAGHSRSGLAGDKTQASRGETDYWVIKIDENGNKVWDKRFGGDGFDLLDEVIKTQDGNYLLGGNTTSSQSGDVSQAGIGGSNPTNLTDFWLVKIDENGNKIWDKRFGTNSDNEELKALIETPEGDYLYGGTTHIPNQVNNSLEFTVGKIDASGNQLYYKTFEGNQNDELSSILPNKDGTHTLIGDTDSGIGGDKTIEGIGAWLLTINANGEKIKESVIANVRAITDAIDSPDGFRLIASNIMGDNNSEMVITKIGQCSNAINLCKGEVIELVASGCAGTVKWYSSGNSSSSVGEGHHFVAFPQHQYSTQETYTAKCYVDGCESALSNQIEIFFGGSLAISPNPTSNAPICEGQTLNLSSISGANTYLWTGPNGFSSAEQNPSILNTSTDFEGIYTITLNAGSNCESTATISVAINSVSQPSITHNGPLCSGQTLQFNTENASRFEWTGPNSFFSELQNPTIINASEANSGIYTLTIFTETGCQVSSTAEIMVSADIIPNPQAIANAINCSGETLNLSSSGGTHYLWAGPNSFSSTLQNPNILISNPLQSGIYTLTVTNGTSCSASTTISPSINISQAPIITKTICSDELKKIWDKKLGGTSNEYLTAAIKTNDGNYLYGGYTQSELSGTISENAIGNYDYWVIKTDVDGNKLWDKRFGGVADDYLTTIVENNNGQYLLGGYSNSIQTTNSYNYGLNDFYLVLIDANGNFVKDKQFGGSGNDELYAITPTSSGGYVLGGHSSSNSSTPLRPTDKSQNSRGMTDYWIINIDNSWTKVWDKTFGGSNIDELNAIVKTLDGGYLLAGTSLSGNNGDKSQPSQGTSDYWVVRINNLGTKIWDKRFGSNSYDNLSSLLTTDDGGYLLGGTSSSGQGGDKTQISQGSDDFWVVKINELGTKIWDKRFGGNDLEALTTMQKTTDGSYLLGGYTYSSQNGDVSKTSKGGADYWLVKLGQTGTKIWDFNFGGNDDDYMASILTRDNIIYNLGGYSFSPISGDVSQFGSGESDFWAINTSFCVPTDINCEGSLITLIASNCDGSVQWSNGMAGKAITNLLQGTYSAVCLTNNNCESFQSNQITIEQLPIPAISSNSPICFGSLLSLNTAQGGGVSYLWTGPNNFSSTLQNPTNLSTSNLRSGTYNVTITDANGCKVSNTTEVIINNVNMNIASNSPVCSGSALNLSSSGGEYYIWSGPNGFSSTLQNPVIQNINTSQSGAYTVTVTNLNGCTATNSVVVLVNELPIIELASNSPICAGSMLNLNSFGGVSYTWTGPNNFSSTLQNPTILNTSTLQSGTYTISVIGSNGCIATETTLVIIKENPTPTIINSSPICEGQSFSLTGSGGVHYSWSQLGVGSFSENPLTRLANSSSSGTYILTVTDVDGCTATTSTVVTVNPSPPPHVYDGGLGTCIGSKLYLKIQSNTNTSDLSYSWTGPNNFSSTLQNPVIENATIQAMGTYEYTITNPFGCKISGNQFHTLVAPPELRLDYNVSDCKITFTNSIGNNGGEFEWTGPNSFTSTLPNPIIENVTVSNSGLYSVVYYHFTDQNEENHDGDEGCVVTASTMVNIAESMPISVSSNSSICEGSTLNLNALGGVSYLWTGPNNFSSTLQNPSILSAINSDSGIYTITITNTSGCKTTSTISVLIHATPVVNISSNSPVCVGSSLNLSVNSSVNYFWSGPNSFSSTLQNPNIINISSSQSGIYTVTLTSEEGCIASNTTSVLINNLPNTAITTNSPVCAGETLNLNAVYSSTANYFWSGPNSFSSTVQNSTIINSKSLNSGIYTLTITNIDGCVATNTTEVIIHEILVSDVSVISNSPICEGSTLIFQKSGLGTFQGLFGNEIFYQGENIVIPNVSPSYSGNYEIVQARDRNGCLIDNIGSIAVDVFARPISTTPSTITVCQGETLNLVSSGGVSYIWTGPNGFSSTLQNPVILNVTNSALGIYTVMVTNENGCTATTAITLLINPKPILNITNPPAVTPPATVNISDTNWYIGSININSATLTYYTDAQANITLSNPAAVAVSGTYYVKATSPNGCFDIKPIVVQIGNCNNLPVSLNSPTDNINNQTNIIKTTDIITANNKITGTSNITYRSGKSILLTPTNGGFTVANGAVFKAEIGGCQ